MEIAHWGERVDSWCVNGQQLILISQIFWPISSSPTILQPNKDGKVANIFYHWVLPIGTVEYSLDCFRDSFWKRVTSWARMIKKKSYVCSKGCHLSLDGVVELFNWKIYKTNICDADEWTTVQRIISEWAEAVKLRRGLLIRRKLLLHFKIFHEKSTASCSQWDILQYTSMKFNQEQRYFHTLQPVQSHVLFYI